MAAGNDFSPADLAEVKCEFVRTSDNIADIFRFTSLTMTPGSGQR